VAVRSKASVWSSLDCWDHGFESRWGHGCSSLVFVLCCVGSRPCDELITRSEESLPHLAAGRARVCVCVCDLPQQRGNLDPSWAVVPQTKIVNGSLNVITEDLFIIGERRSSTVLAWCVLVIWNEIPFSWFSCAVMWGAHRVTVGEPGLVVLAPCGQVISSRFFEETYRLPL
jgi:hypothetical protein